MVNATGIYIGLLKIGNLTKEKYGYGTLRVMRTFLHETLLKRLDEEGIPVKNGMRLTEIEETSESVKVIFADGTEDTCDLLVGADGIHSAVRTLHVQPNLEPEYTGFSTLSALIPTNSLASPMYFEGNFGAIMSRRGMFATGFCDKTRETMYWFNSHEVGAKSREGWIAYGSESAAVKEELIERVKEITIPLVKEILEKSPEVRMYPIYRLPLSGKWFTERTILIGDSGHGTLPFCRI